MDSNKSIIVDDVNVEECEFVSKEHSFTNPKGQCKIKLKDYKFVNNCYFKQIKRLEQAKEELQNLWANSTAERIKLEKENEKYKQVLEDIKSIAEYSIKHNENLNLNHQLILTKIIEVLNANSININ